MMILKFTVGNFLSIKDNQTISFEASSLKELRRTNVGVSDDKKHHILRSIAIYGANASGKSNFIKALAFLKEFVVYSSMNYQVGRPIGVVPFKLSASTLEQPCYFEIEFIAGPKDNCYRYALALDNGSVQYEKLYLKKVTTEQVIFERIFNNFTFGKGNEDFFEEVKKFTRLNASFLSLISQFNQDVGAEVVNWFSNIIIIHGAADEIGFNHTAELLQDNKYKHLITQLLKNADLGFSRVNVTRVKDHNRVAANMFLDELKPTYDIRTVHYKYDENNESKDEIDFNISEESEGTQKYFAMSGWLSESLSRGSLIVVDELDSKLHPQLTKAIIKYFNSSYNLRNAQLLFATHNISALDNDLLRRDQVYFTQKTKFSETVIYPLSSLKSVRNDTSYGKNYLAGNFGAIPELNDQLDLF